jgi:hypothetical protein
LYLITNIDIDNRYIEFNQIGDKEELLKYLESLIDVYDNILKKESD